MARGKGPKRISAAAQGRIERAFAQQLGQAIIHYSRVETFLCTWFERITKMPSPMARRAFYSQGGTYPTLQLFRAVMDGIALVPDVKPFLTAAINNYRSTQKYEI